MHICFDYVHNNAICDKKYEIVACIINVWGLNGNLTKRKMRQPKKSA